ncbi:hypothetical protein B296_00045906 [Ensete ventricosum]|uniref:Glycosyltransferase subfamily 4-like N-terminal domain-containing protein n=1 Tax=Ensete ventricosum TaxID=4639 RepID=A0A426X9G8_ENSVE|nr:hypothetical protein B296_00045906 [Ensete ventricosum]
MQYRTPPKSVERRSRTRQRGREERNHRSVSPCSSNNASSRRAFSADLRHVDFSWYSLRLRPDRPPSTGVLDEIRFFHDYAHHVATSDSTGEMHAARRLPDLSSGRVHVILNGVDEDKFAPDVRLGAAFRKEIGLPGGATLVMGVAGRLVKDKGCCSVFHQNPLPFVSDEAFYNSVGRVLEPHAEAAGTGLDVDGSRWRRRGCRASKGPILVDKGCSLPPLAYERTKNKIIDIGLGSQHMAMHLGGPLDSLSSRSKPTKLVHFQTVDLGNGYDLHVAVWKGEPTGAWDPFKTSTGIDDEVMVWSLQLAKDPSTSAPKSLLCSNYYVLRLVNHSARIASENLVHGGGGHRPPLPCMRRREGGREAHGGEASLHEVMGMNEWLFGGCGGAAQPSREERTAACWA